MTAPKKPNKAESGSGDIESFTEEQRAARTRFIEQHLLLRHGWLRQQEILDDVGIDAMAAGGVTVRLPRRAAVT